MDMALAGCNSFHDGWLACYVGLPRDPPSAHVLREADLDGFHAGWDTCNETSFSGRGHAFKRMLEVRQVRSFWIDDNGDEIE